MTLEKFKNIIDQLIQENSPDTNICIHGHNDIEILKLHDNLILIEGKED